MGNLNTSRRALLSAALAVPVAAVPAVAAACPITAETIAWDRLIAAFQQAQRASDHYDETVWHPARDAVERIAPRPEMTFAVAAANGQIAEFRFHPDRPDEWEQSGPQCKKAASQMKEKWRAHRSARASVRLNAIEDEVDRLSDLVCEARWAAIQTPAPHLAALRWKLDQLFGLDARGGVDGESPVYTSDVVNDFMADVYRLLPEGRA